MVVAAAFIVAQPSLLRSSTPSGVPNFPLPSKDHRQFCAASPILDLPVEEADAVR